MNIILRNLLVLYCLMNRTESLHHSTGKMTFQVESIYGTVQFFFVRRTVTIAIKISDSLNSGKAVIKN